MRKKVMKIVSLWLRIVLRLCVQLNYLSILSICTVSGGAWKRGRGQRWAWNIQEESKLSHFPSDSTHSVSYHPFMRDLRQGSPFALSYCSFLMVFYNTFRSILTSPEHFQGCELIRSGRSGVVLGAVFQYTKKVQWWVIAETHWKRFAKQFEDSIRSNGEKRKDLELSNAHCKQLAQESNYRPTKR